MEKHYVIGIDLGTTYSCVAVWINDRVEIISNDQGNRTTPSYVGFGDDHLIGDAAKNHAVMNVLNTIFDVKRLIGKKFTDPGVQEDIKQFPFQVIDSDDKPIIKVIYQGETHLFSPEQISSMILTKMKNIAEDYLGCSITEAVITVPAYFNDAQRQATKDAGTIAGLNVLRIINEPTAAALAYGLDKKTDGEVYIIVFDFGGGTHDVTLLSMENGYLEVKATAGDNHLGGEDIDNNLTTYFTREIKKNHGIELNAKARRRLKNACEQAKCTLSTAQQTTLNIDSLFEGNDFVVTLTRAKFEEINYDIFERIMEPVKKVLDDGHINKEKIGEIVLVGGSTRIPKVRKMLQNFFNKEVIRENVNPDEAVAYGAAIQAAIISGTSERLGGILLVDVTPLTIGVETYGGLMEPLINRNTTIPCRASKIFTTCSDNQQVVKIRIYEGERSMIKDNNLLGSFDLRNISPAPARQPRIEVICTIDDNGILNVTAVDKSSNSSNTVIITGNKDRNSSVQINKMLEEAERFHADDLMRKQLINARNELEGYARAIKEKLSEKDTETVIDSVTRNSVAELCNEIISSIDKEQELDYYKERKKCLEETWNPYFSKISSYHALHS